MRAATQADLPQGIVPRTQFGRMLGIRIIAASSLQTTGRVERARGTPQDRLVKKLRLARITSYAAATPRPHPRTLREVGFALRGDHRRRPAYRQVESPAFSAVS